MVDCLVRLGAQSISAAAQHASRGWLSSREINLDSYYKLNPQRAVLGYRPSGIPPRPALSIWICFGRPALEPESRPVPFMRADDIVRWWQLKVGSTDQVAHTALKSRESGPHELVQAGYEFLIEEHARKSPDIAKLGACLSVVGLGASSILNSRICSLCGFRRSSIIRSNRCTECSRSKLVVDMDQVAEAAARVQRIRRAAPLKRLASDLPFDIDDTHLPFFTRSTASILFNMPKGCDAHCEWIEKVAPALGSAPYVKSLLGDSFLSLTPTEQWQMLRLRLDANQWDYEAWPGVIQRAQELHDNQVAARSRRKISGPTRTTQSKAHDARKLLAEGKSKSEVAKLVGISASHLAHILRRTFDSK